MICSLVTTAGGQSLADSEAVREVGASVSRLKQAETGPVASSCWALQNEEKMIKPAMTVTEKTEATARAVDKTAMVMAPAPKPARTKLMPERTAWPTKAPRLPKKAPMEGIRADRRGRPIVQAKTYQEGRATPKRPKTNWEMVPMKKPAQAM